MIPLIRAAGLQAWPDRSTTLLDQTIDGRSLDSDKLMDARSLIKLVSESLFKSLRMVVCQKIGADVRPLISIFPSGPATKPSVSGAQFGLESPFGVSKIAATPA